MNFTMTFFVEIVYGLCYNFAPWARRGGDFEATYGIGLKVSNFYAGRASSLTSSRLVVS